MRSLVSDKGPSSHPTTRPDWCRLLGRDARGADTLRRQAMRANPRPQWLDNRDRQGGALRREVGPCIRERTGDLRLVAIGSPV
jgi:hypothetical protein